MMSVLGKAVDSRIPYVHEVGLQKGYTYMILDYIAGDNRETVISTSSNTV